jgi:hypothetical protein
VNDINKMGEFINSWGEISFGFMVGFVLLKNSDQCKSGNRVAHAWGMVCFSFSSDFQGCSFALLKGLDRCKSSNRVALAGGMVWVSLSSYF